MATVETDTTSIAVINTNVGYIQRDIATINMNIKELANVYATQASVVDTNKAVDIRLKRLEDSSNLWKFLSPTLAAIFGSVLTFLIIEFLTSGK